MEFIYIMWSFSSILPLKKTTKGVCGDGGDQRPAVPAFAAATAGISGRRCDGCASGGAVRTRGWSVSMLKGLSHFF